MKNILPFRFCGPGPGFTGAPQLRFKLNMKTPVAILAQVELAGLPSTVSFKLAGLSPGRDEEPKIKTYFCTFGAKSNQVEKTHNPHVFVPGPGGRSGPQSNP